MSGRGRSSFTKRQKERSRQEKQREKAERKVVPRMIGIGPMGMSPIIDGVVLKHHPFDAAASPESAQVAFLVGSNQDESVLFLGGRPDWGKLTDDDLEVIAGKREALIGKLQERYGMAKEEAQRKADEWLKSYSDEQPAFGRTHEEAGREHSAGKR